MSKIDDLINGECPNGVEYRTLKDLEDLGVITLGRGKVISKKDIQDNPGEYPIYSSSAVGSGIFGTYGDYMFDDVRLSWSIDGGGKFFYRDAPKYSVTNVCGWLTVNKPEVLNIRYLYFVLINEWGKKVFDYTHKAHPSVIRKEYTIPVPPLSIQQELVRILDSFTELETKLESELKTEMQKRQQQYQYYADKLLEQQSLSKDCAQQKSLGEIAAFTYGYGAKAQESGDARFIRITDIDEKGKIIPTEPKYVNILPENKKYILKENDLLVARTGATFGKTALFREKYPAIYAGFLIKVSFNEDILLPEFYWHFAQSHAYWNQAKKLVKGGGQPQLNANTLKNIKIFIPPISRQKEIIGKLNKYNKFHSELMLSLPAEIEARRKQYEYYRNKLLTFKERVV